MEKGKLRQSMLARRNAMDPGEAALSSALICEKLLALDCVKNAACVMAYCAYKNEPDLNEFIKTLMSLGKAVALPYIAGTELKAVRYESGSVMNKSKYGIPEPVFINDADELKPDVVVVPGIAFDSKLYRIGFGGGYYDRFLASSNAYKTGVCYDYQVVEGFACEAHDVPMDVVVTEKRIIGGKGCA
jgi:5-formyltetrahydrofolate cyclo-ligase